jgi:hypothetical protein
MILVEHQMVTGLDMEDSAFLDLHHLDNLEAEHRSTGSLRNLCLQNTEILSSQIHDPSLPASHVVIISFPLPVLGLELFFDTRTYPHFVPYASFAGYDLPQEPRNWSDCRGQAGGYPVVETSDVSLIVCEIIK